MCEQKLEKLNSYIDNFIACVKTMSAEEYY